MRLFKKVFALHLEKEIDPSFEGWDQELIENAQKIVVDEGRKAYLECSLPKEEQHYLTDRWGGDRSDCCLVTGGIAYRYDLDDLEMVREAVKRGCK